MNAWCMMVRLLALLTFVLGIVACGDQPTPQERSVGSSGSASRTETEAEPLSRRGKESREVEATYDLMVRWNDVYASYRITLNGFPLWVQGFKGQATRNEFDVSLNTALVGSGNQVAVSMEPRLRSGGKHLQVADIDWEAWVRGHFDERVTEITEAEVDSAYRAWVGRAEEKWTEYRSRVEEGALDSMRAWAARNPMVVSTRFDNEHGPDFSRVFEEAPVLKDTPATRKRLTDYAMRLRDLLRDRRGAELYREVRPAVRARAGDDFAETSDSVRAARWSKDATKGKGWFTDVEADADFSRSDVQLRRWVEGRVWELFREEGKPLLGGWEIFVGEREGELKVVRLQAP